MAIHFSLHLGGLGSNHIVIRFKPALKGKLSTDDGNGLATICGQPSELIIFRLLSYHYTIKAPLKQNHIWSKRRQTETFTPKITADRNVEKMKRRQSNTLTNRHVDEPNRRQNEISTNQNVVSPEQLRKSWDIQHMPCTLHNSWDIIFINIYVDKYI